MEMRRVVDVVIVKITKRAGRKNENVINNNRKTRLSSKGGWKSMQNVTKVAAELQNLNFYSLAILRRFPNIKCESWELLSSSLAVSLTSVFQMFPVLWLCDVQTFYDIKHSLFAQKQQPIMQHHKYDMWRGALLDMNSEFIVMPPLNENLTENNFELWWEQWSRSLQLVMFYERTYGTALYVNQICSFSLTSNNFIS